MKTKFITILELAESFKMMNQPGPTVALFDGLFLKSIKDGEIKL